MASGCAPHACGGDPEAAPYFDVEEFCSPRLWGLAPLRRGWAAGPRAGPARPTMGPMSAQPVHQEDPRDPEVILRDLPAREREQFLREYHEAVDAAHEPAGYRSLQRVLHRWSLIVVATNKPGYYEAIEDAKNGVGIYTPIEQVIPDWEARVAAARAER